MPHHFHAVVWIDYEDARIFGFGTSGVERTHIRATDHTGHIHHKSGTVGSGHALPDKAYLTAIVKALESAQEILIVGHGGAKGTAALLVPLGNVLMTATGSWTAVFIIAAALNIVAAVMALFVLKPMRERAMAQG